MAFSCFTEKGDIDGSNYPKPIGTFLTKEECISEAYKVEVREQLVMFCGEFEFFKATKSRER
jgi:hypothetical protein